MDGKSPITELKGIGEKTQKLFGKLNIRTVDELLAAYPYMEIGRASCRERV